MSFVEIFFSVDFLFLVFKFTSSGFLFTTVGLTRNDKADCLSKLIVFGSSLIIFSTACSNFLASSMNAKLKPALQSLIYLKL